MQRPRHAPIGKSNEGPQGRAAIRVWNHPRVGDYAMKVKYFYAECGAAAKYLFSNFMATVPRA
jgi:hypothetical protein